MRFLGAILLISLSFTAQAQTVDTNSFTIRLFANNDTTPPPVPVLSAVEPVASTQVDVTWGAVVDDYFLAGYVLYRDNVAIATTTQTSFSDTGLTPSTTYAYNVQAFDASGNYSATSTSLATTTPNAPVVATTTDQTGGTGTAVRVVLTDFSLTTKDTSASIQLSTALPSQISVRWGRSASYELGYSLNSTFLRDFETNITDLEPGTTYEYEITGMTPRGSETVLKRGQFTTENLTATTPPNVRLLSATTDGNDVSLNWELPNTDIAYIRVVRSHLGFPGNPADGAIVYQGQGTSYFDKAVLARFSPIYYTVFVFDETGNVSSGAVVQAVLQSDGIGIVVSPNNLNQTPEETGEEIEIFNESATTTNVLPTASSSAVRIPNLGEIMIRTTEATFSLATPEIVIGGNQSMVIGIPSAAISRNLKTILVSLSDPANPENQYSYILRLNKDATAYEAVIEPMEKSGWSQLTVAIYDYETRMVSRYNKRVRFGEALRGEQPVFFPDYFLERPFYVIGGVSVLVLVTLLITVLSRRRLKNI